MKKIKNYTSQVASERTISMIEKELVSIGANKIEKNYSNMTPAGIKFTIDLEGKEICFLLPANIDSAYDCLKLIPEYKKKNTDWLKGQSQRTAWKIIYEWVIVQVAMIQLGQAEAIQIFLPYIYSEKLGTTVYDRIKSNGQFLLE